MAAPTPRKKTTKAHVPPQPTEEQITPPAQALEPVLIRPKADAPPVEMITAFELDDVEYQIPKEPTPGQIMAYLNDVHRWGVQEAMIRVVFNALGQEAMNALAASKSVTVDDVAAVSQFVQRWFLGSTGLQQVTGK